MTRTHRTLLILAAAAGLSAGPAGDASPGELVRRGNEAFARGDAAAADRFYETAAERIADPGLVAFNRAAVRFAAGDFRGAEAEYARALADAAVPPGRRARALFNRGVCLLQRGGDAATCRAAVTCFEGCLDADSGDTGLSADARYNLEVAKVRWGQARAKEKTPPKANDPPPEGTEPEPRSQPGPGGDEPPGADPGTRATPAGPPEPVTGPVPGGAEPRPTDRRVPGVGNLPVVLDADEPQPLSPADTRALLKQAADRLDRDRKSTARLLAGPERADVRDW